MYRKRHLDNVSVGLAVLPDPGITRESVLENEIWLHTMGGRQFLAPITLHQAHVLDVGCGSGAWAMDVGMVPSLLFCATFSAHQWMLYS